MNQTISEWQPLPPASGSLSAPYNNIIFKLVKDQTISIGRNENCDFVPPESFNNISPVHCFFRTKMSDDKQRFVIFVRNNGPQPTYVNNNSILEGEWVELSGGDTIHLGGVSDGTLALVLTVYAPDSVDSEFDIIEIIGSGASGTVRKSQNRLVGGIYAIKQVSRTPPEGQRDRAPEEYQSLETLVHENIVKLFAFLPEAKYYYFVMAYAPYKSVDKLIKSSHGLDNAVARSITRETSEALHYMHDVYRMVHRDIKPENVLVFNVHPIHIKVADFGLSRVMSGNTSLQSAVGSPHYAAPEIIKQKGRYDLKVDSWSLGMMIFTMLAGRPAFSKKQVLRTMQKDEPKDLREINWDLLPDNTDPLARELIVRLTATVPENRLSPAQVLTHPWLTGRSSMTQSDA